MRRLLIAILIVLTLLDGISAVELESRFDIQAVEAAVPSDASELLEVTKPGSSLSDGLSTILKNAVQQLDDPVRASVKSCALLVGIILLCSVAASTDQEQSNRAVKLAGILALASAGLLSVNSMIQDGEDTLRSMQSFADVFLPVMTAATAASGGFTSSAALQIGTSFFSDLLIRAMTGMFIPAMYIYLGLRIADAALEQGGLAQAAKLTKDVLQSALKLILFVFTAYLTITGIISGTADATTVKAAKLTLSGVVPLVGSMISDASEAVVVSAGLVRNSVGVFGMLAILAICVGPFLRTAVPYLLLRVCIAVCAGFALKAHISVLEAMEQSLGFLLAMTGTAALLLLVSAVCYMRVMV